jgi:hypothetical protein
MIELLFSRANGITLHVALDLATRETVRAAIHATDHRVNDLLQFFIQAECGAASVRRRPV